ncbi:response regulator [Desulfatiferula olefinivorans]
MADILIIDDDTQLCAMLKQLLERRGYQVITAADGDEGLALYAREGARLVITDLIMPVREGIETIAELIKSSPDVTIFAMSGGGRLKPDSYLNLAETFGAIRTFTKPIDRTALLAAVAEVLA